MIDHFQNGEGYREGVCAGEYGGAKLKKKLMDIAFYKTADAVYGADREDTKQNRSDHAADAVNTPDIERVIPVKPGFQLDREIAYRTGSKADQHGCPRLYEAGCRCDCRKSCHGTGKNTDKARFSPVPMK